MILGFKIAVATNLLLLSTTVIAQNGQYSNQTEPDAPVYPLSQPYYPTPRIDGAGDWADAYKKAKAFVDQLTLLEKVNLTTGTGSRQGNCVGNTGSIPRLNFRALCLADGPLGFRVTDYNTAFPAGPHVAATWDRGLLYARGFAMGEEFRGKGANIALSPVAGPLGRHPEAGRNFEGFSVDPWLTGVSIYETIKGIQDAGVVATAKHFILNEQEHFRRPSEFNGIEHRNITQSLSNNVDDRTMHELYLWPFADAVRAGVGAFLCAYTQTNNSYNCQNSQLLNGLLKDELDFQGFVMSDWEGQHSGVASALAGLDMSMPGDSLFGSGTAYFGGNLTLAVLNGSVPEWRIDDMVTRIMAAYFKVGQDPETYPDVNSNQNTRDTFGYEHFLVSEGYGVVNYHIDVRKDHDKVARAVAAKGTVLLKNVDGVLPLGKVKQIGIFGSDAGESKYGPNGCKDRGCAEGTIAVGWGSGSYDFPYLITPLEAIKARAIQQGSVVQSVLDDYAYSQINTTARQASVCLVFVKADSGESYIFYEGNEGDRNNLTLWYDGDTLINTVAASCNNTIVVIHAPGPVLLEAFIDNPNITAVILAGFPGQESGNAIADILYGDINPSGKLPFTIAKNQDDYGTHLMYEPNGLIPQDNFTEGLFVDYRHFDKAGIEPRYEFGFGLSYTTFSYSDLEVKKITSAPYVPATGYSAPVETTNTTVTGDFEEYTMPESIEANRVSLYIYPYIESASSVSTGSAYPVPEGAYDTSAQPIPPAGGAPGGNPSLYQVVYEVSAKIKNTGSVFGEEVAQAYIATGLEDDPVRVLRGFEKVALGPGQEETITFRLTRKDLARWDVVSQDWVILDGEKTILVGSSSRNMLLNGTLA
ncbi:hypothetical protein RUND412_006580 [Rhizina undulata]